MVLLSSRRVKRSPRFTRDMEVLSLQFPTLEQSVLNFEAALVAGHELPLTPISDEFPEVFFQGVDLVDAPSVEPVLMVTMHRTVYDTGATQWVLMRVYTRH